MNDDARQIAERIEADICDWLGLNRLDHPMVDRIDCHIGPLIEAGNEIMELRTGHAKVMRAQQRWKSALEAAKGSGDASCFNCDENFHEQCQASERSCGHHCNCVWIHDECCWCGKKFEDEEQPPGPSDPPPGKPVIRGP